MKYSPHEYQAFATNFILEHPIAAVLLDMGLGKSVITLTAIEELMHDRFEVNRVLVIAPLRVATNTWPSEIKKWDHLHDITYSVAVGTEAQRKAALGKLVPYVNNARTHSPEQVNKLRSSLREFGFINPVIIDRDFGVIAGHGRILAAKEEGIAEVPCVFADHLTEAQKKAYIIADNRMALDAGWDEELLRVEIEALQAEAFDLSLTGFDEKELYDLFKADDDVQEDDFDVDAELEKPTVTKSGDVWTLGRHRLVCGDSTKMETFDTLMQGRKANLVVTDPPYNVNYEGTAGKIKNDNMADEKFYQFLLDAFSCMEKVMADDASIYVFHADTEGLNFRKAFSDAGFYLSGCCIWKKPSLVLGRSPYQWQRNLVWITG